MNKEPTYTKTLYSPPKQLERRR